MALALLSQRMDQNFSPLADLYLRPPLERLLRRLFPATLADLAGLKDPGGPGWQERLLGPFGRIFCSFRGRMPRGEYVPAAFLLLVLQVLAGAALYYGLYGLNGRSTGVFIVTAAIAFVLFFLMASALPLCFACLWSKRLRDAGRDWSGGRLLLLAVLSLNLPPVLGVILFVGTGVLALIVLPHFLFSLLLAPWPAAGRPAPPEPLRANPPGALARKLFPRASALPDASAPERARLDLLRASRRLGAFGRIFLSPYGRMSRGEFALGTCLGTMLLALLLLLVALAADGAWELFVPDGSGFGLTALAIIVVMVALLVAYSLSLGFLLFKRLADVGLRPRHGLWLALALVYALPVVLPWLVPDTRPWLAAVLFYGVFLGVGLWLPSEREEADAAAEPGDSPASDFVR